MNVPAGLEMHASPVDGLGIFASQDFPSGYFFGFFEAFRNVLEKVFVDSNN